MTTLTLIRGLPGSGKSTLAGIIQSSSMTNRAMRFEADMYFEDKGIYKFDSSKLHLAHKWCYTMTELHLKGNTHVIVSNTFTTQSEIQPYINLAKELGCTLNVITCNSNFGSIHDVPASTIEKMKQRFQHNIVL